MREIDHYWTLRLTDRQMGRLPVPAPATVLDKTKSLPWPTCQRLVYMLMLGLGEKGGVVKREKEKLKREASRYRLWTVGEKEEGHYLSLTHVMYQ